MTRSVQTFISYRRADAEDAAGRIYDALTGRFEDEDVFMDIDTIGPGLDFAKVISDAVARCDVLVAVIGRNWLNATDAKGRRRLDNPKDFVRIEIAAALDRDVRVIPALVQGVDMPHSEELPEQIAGLADRQAVDLSHDRFRSGVEKLIQALESLEKARSEHGKQPLREPDLAGVASTQPSLADDDQQVSSSPDESTSLLLRLHRSDGEGEYKVVASSPAGEATGEFRVPLTADELEILVLRLGQGRRAWR